jgi:hypothetical protein
MRNGKNIFYEKPSALRGARWEKLGQRRAQDWQCFLIWFGGNKSIFKGLIKDRPLIS